ncbi:MAG: hypothetical protein JNL98_34545 [Bryobacterales bacterium]|nr:hypothetical protein [Bryobacterales bacterium]
MLKRDGSAIRYTGEVWEYSKTKQYELQAHGGFVADGGHWKSNVGGALKVVFDKTAAEKTVPAPSGGGRALPVGPCSTSGPLAKAREITCGAVKLKRIDLKSMPKAVDAALLRAKDSK